MQTKDQLTKLENLNKQIRISDVISVLVAQSTQLIDMVNKNQKEVNRLKEEQSELASKLEDDTAVQHGIKCANDFFESRLK